MKKLLVLLILLTIGSLSISQEQNTGRSALGREYQANGCTYPIGWCTR